MSEEIQDQDADTEIICNKAVSLELALKDIRLNNAFQIHSDYKECIETNCQGDKKDCEYRQSYILSKRLS